MENLKMALYTIAIVTASFFLGCFSGEKEKETEIKNRALELDKECYTNQDIEYIIFKEQQL